MTRVSADLLILLHEVASAGSINRTSQKLSLPKSTISRRLRQLEHEVGALLVKRGTRKITMTEIGQVLLERSQRIAAEVELAQIQAVEMQTKVRGELRVSLPTDFGPSWIGSVLGNFATTYPEIDLSVDVNAHAVDVSEENYDVAIHLGPFAGAQDLPMKTLARLSRGFYASADYLKQRPGPQSGADLANHDCVMHDNQVREGVWRMAGLVDVAGREARHIRINSIGLVKDLVVKGTGIGILTNIMCEADVRSGRLIRLIPEIELPSFVVSATFLHSRHIPRKTRVFIDYLAQSLRSAGSGNSGPGAVPNLA